MRLFTLLWLVTMLSGCAHVDQMANKVLDAATEVDPISGQRRLSDDSEAEELKRATATRDAILREAAQANVGVNSDPRQAEALKEIMRRIVSVSHRPDLPWEVYLLDVPEVNAFTVGGGKIFFLSGIFGTMVLDADEVAAVMAHEIGHVTARHGSENDSINMIAGVANRKRKKDAVFHASYSTVQEDEADRLGLLYMALAGFDPRAAARVWARDHQEHGSRYDQNTHDHSLSLDRWRRVKGLEATVLRYYSGPGQVNPDAQAILANNAITGRRRNEASTGMLGLLESGLGAAGDYSKTKQEQRYREAQRAREEQALRLVTLGEWKRARAQNGQAAMFGKFHNGATTPMQEVALYVFYVDGKGKVLYRQRVAYQNVRPGWNEWNAYVLNVPGTADIRVGVGEAR